MSLRVCARAKALRRRRQAAYSSSVQAADWLPPKSVTLEGSCVKVSHDGSRASACKPKHRSKNNRFLVWFFLVWHLPLSPSLSPLDARSRFFALSRNHFLIYRSVASKKKQLFHFDGFHMTQHSLTQSFLIMMTVNSEYM